MTGGNRDRVDHVGAEALAARLRALRVRALLTQEELAERSGVSVGTISGIEVGRIRQPRGSTLQRLADALRLPASERAALLGGGPGRPGEGERMVPRQLPADVAAFTGRQRELAQLETVLAAVERQPGPVVISAIQGTGGIGKSALAIHAAHRLAAAYPDGQLYVDLHGATAGLQLLAPLEVLGRFLRALGVDPAAIPADLDEAAAAYRSQLATRRLLLVLDNARDAAQVRPLLPGTPGCGVLVTSRRALAGLEGAWQLHLDVLSEPEAVELLGRLAGPERVAAEPDAAARIVGCCGRLPLALRVAGARLAARPSWPLSQLAERLDDQQRRLDELELADVGVRASLAVSYQELAHSPDATDRAAATAFGLIGLLEGPEVGVPVVARLLDSAEARAERVLERLVDAQILETSVPGRYRLHDLLRLYARELAARQHAEAARATALTRAFGFYTATVWGTLALLRPDDHRLGRADDRWRKDRLEFADAAAAFAWLEVERINLLAAVHQAAATPGILGEISLQLARGMFGFLWMRNYWDDLARVNQAALGVARRLGDRAAQATAHNDLGSAYWHQCRYEEALACIQECVALYRELGDRRGQAGSLGNLGHIHRRQGRDARALACQQESLALYRELDDRRGQAHTLGNLGVAYERQGRYEEALACLRESLVLYRELGDRHGEAVVLCNHGEIHTRQGRFEEALACLQASLTLCEELGDRWVEAYILHDLGVVRQRQGRHDQALAYLQEGLTIRRELGDPHGQGESLRDLGVSLRALGHSEEAMDAWSEALAILEQLHAPEADEVRALLTERDTSERRSVETQVDHR